jgi:drug/metabolite transporter (DMT)-like permease
MRTGIAALLLAFASRRRFASSLRGLSPRRRAVFLFAGSLLAAHFALFLGGLARTSLAAAVALVSLEPIAVVMAAFVAFRLVPTRREIVGLLVAMAGAVIVASGSGAGEHHIEGDLMVLGCVVLFGAYVAAARGLRDAMPAMPYAASVYGVASILLLPFAALSPPSEAAAQDPRAWWAVVTMALVPTLVGHTLVQTAARRAPPVLVALVSPGETIGSLAIGAFVMGKPPTLREGVGALLVLSGATLAVTWRRD